MGRLRVAILKKTVIFIIIIILNSSLIFADSLTTIKSELLYQLSTQLLNKQKISVYISANIFNDVKSYKGMQRVYFCSKADIIVADNTTNISRDCFNKIIISTNYRTYKDNNNITGAIFWQKGRLNILFKKDKIKKFLKHINKELQKFLD
jgi:hypothetical protein